MSPRRQPTPAELRALARRDPVLGRWIAKLPPLPPLPVPSHARLTHYEVLARSILYQQLSGKAAATIWRRACALGPRGRFPNERELECVNDAELRAAGVSGPKIRGLRSLAEASLSGTVRLRSLARRDDEAIIEELTQVRGIGRWTAEMFLMFKLGRLDVMPVHDLGIQKGLARLDELAERPKPDEVLERSEPWAPLRTVASWYLWRLTEMPNQR